MIIYLPTTTVSATATVKITPTTFATATEPQAPNGAAYSFSDVSADDWAYKDVRKLAEASIVSGDKLPQREGGGLAGVTLRSAAALKPKFRPDDTLSREECAVILARLDGMIDRVDESRETGADAGRTGRAARQASRSDAEPQIFSDVAGSRWSYQYIETSKKYLPGVGAQGAYASGGVGLFMPEAPTLRGDLISALMRLTGSQPESANASLLDDFTDAASIRDDWRPYLAIAVNKAVLLGDENMELRADEPVSRREACALIVRALRGSLDFPEPEVRTIYAPDLDSGFYDLYYDDVVFVGDSITMGLRNYVLSERSRGNPTLGEARFLCAGSYGLRAASGAFNPNGVNLNYQGEDLPLEDCLQKMGAKSAMLMLGMNDWAGAALSGDKAKYETILDKIFAKNPDININIEFCTPISYSREGKNLNNTNMDAFNGAIVEICDERGLDFIDVNTPMKDGNNALKDEYVSDGYVHMSSAGCRIWIEALRKFAMEKYIAGQWTPPAGDHPALSYNGSYIEID